MSGLNAGSAPPSVSRNAALFDLDGTLIDHFATLYRCYKYTLEQLGLPVPSREIVRRSVGGSVEVTMRHFVAEAQCEEAVRLWREHLGGIYLEEVALMPGARELVVALHARRMRLGVFTNKLGTFSRGIVEHLGLGEFFAIVLGANDTTYRKPEPEFSRIALERLGATPGDSVLVGDSPFDIAAAHGVAMRCACVTTGTHTADELWTSGADAVYPDLATLGAAEFGL